MGVSSADWEFDFARLIRIRFCNKVAMATYGKPMNELQEEQAGKIMSFVHRTSLARQLIYLYIGL